MGNANGLAGIIDSLGLSLALRSFGMGSKAATPSPELWEREGEWQQPAQACLPGGEVRSQARVRAGMGKSVNVYFRDDVKWGVGQATWNHQPSQSNQMQI